MRNIVAVADMKTGHNGDILITHALGSCLGLMVYDPVLKIGGLLHAMLPLSKINPRKAKEKPFMFVDTGVPMLFKELYEEGAQKERLLVKATGCGQPMGKNKMFKIGERNHTILKKLFWKNSILLDAEDIGGTDSRTVSFDLSTGQVIISSKGTKVEL